MAKGVVKLRIHSVCAECAKKAGGKWPDAHQATWWLGVCDACGERKGLCDVRDWDYPLKKPALWGGAGRD